MQRELNNEVKEGGLLSKQILGILNNFKAAKRKSYKVSGACDHSAENQTVLKEKLFNYLLGKHKHATIPIVYFNQRRENCLNLIFFVLICLAQLTVYKHLR